MRLSSGKWLGLPDWRNDKHISPFWEKVTFSTVFDLKDFLNTVFFRQFFFNITFWLIFHAAIWNFYQVMKEKIAQIIIENVVVDN